MFWKFDACIPGLDPFNSKRISPVPSFPLLIHIIIRFFMTLPSWFSFIRCSNEAQVRSTFFLPAALQNSEPNKYTSAIVLLVHRSAKELFYSFGRRTKGIILLLHYYYTTEQALAWHSRYLRALKCLDGRRRSLQKIHMCRIITQANNVTKKNWLTWMSFFSI